MPRHGALYITGVITSEKDLTPVIYSSEIQPVFGHGRGERKRTHSFAALKIWL
jgi:hypothetical protein